MALRPVKMPTRATLRGTRGAVWSEPAEKPTFPRPKGGNPPKASTGVMAGRIYAKLRKLY